MDSAVNSKVEKLRQSCQEAFYRFPNSCSHAVQHVILQYKGNQPYLVANALLDSIDSDPDWQEVSLSELSDLANAGELVVGGAKEGGHGHVIVVYPGTEKQNGGFYFTNMETGERRLARQSGTYARAMSTSMGTFPGAISNGDKTVRDPWGGVAFNKVKFWRYLGPTKNVVTLVARDTRWDLKKDAFSSSKTKPLPTSSSSRHFRLESDSNSQVFTHHQLSTRWLR